MRRSWIFLFVLLSLVPSVLCDVGRITRLHPSAVYVDQLSNAYIVFGRDDQLRFRVWDNTSASWIGDAFNYESKNTPVHYPSFPTGVVPYTAREVADLYVLFTLSSGYFMDYYKWQENSSAILADVPESVYRNQFVFGGGGVRWGTQAIGYGITALDQYVALYDSRWTFKDLDCIYRGWDDSIGEWYKQMLTARIDEPAELGDIGYQPYASYTRNEDGEDEVWISTIASQPGGTDKVLLIKWFPNRREPLGVVPLLGWKYQKGLKTQTPVGYVWRVADTAYRGYDTCWHSCVKATSDYWIYWVYTNEKRQLVIETFTPYAIRIPSDVSDIQWYNEEFSEGWNSWNKTVFETGGGVRNVALDVDDLTGQAHIAYTVEDGGGHVDVYYLYGQTSPAGTMSWNRTLLSDDWAAPKTDYGVAIGLDVKNRFAYIPRARFDSADPGNSYMEYDRGVGKMAVAHYSSFVGNGSISVLSTTVFRGELFNATVKVAAAAGYFRINVDRLNPVTGTWSDVPENVIRVYFAGSQSILTGGDEVEMMLWHAGTYRLSVMRRVGAGFGWEPIPNANVTMTSLETNKDVYILTDWGYRSDEPFNFSVYWNNITSGDWEIALSACDPDEGWEVGVPPSAFDRNGNGLYFRNSTVVPLNGSGGGNWSVHIMPPLANFYAHRGQTWVAVIRRNQTLYPQRDWLRKIFAYMYFKIYYDGMSGNLSVPSTCVEQSIVTIGARVQGLKAAEVAYEQDYVMVDMECLDDASVRVSSFKVPIRGTNGSVVGSFSPAGMWRLTMYAKSSDPDESNYFLDTRTVDVTTGSFLGDAFLNQRRMLGTGLFNALVSGAILLSMCLVIGVYTQSFTAMGVMLLLGGVGFTYVGWLPGWIGAIVLGLAGLMLARLVRAVVGI